jgi:hypothetical protein
MHPGELLGTSSFTAANQGIQQLLKTTLTSTQHLPQINPEDQ